MASGQLPEEGHPGDVASAEPILTPVEASAEDVEEELSDGRGSIEAIEKRRAARRLQRRVQRWSSSHPHDWRGAP